MPILKEKPRERVCELRAYESILQPIFFLECWIVESALSLFLKPAIHKGVISWLPKREARRAR
jgi:hypothetical protein